MAIRFAFSPSFIVAAALALALSSCGDDDGVVDGDGDLTPPGVASVTAVDASHIDVEFNESVQRYSAEYLHNYVITEALRERMPGSQESDTLHLATCALLPDQRTVTLTTAGPMKPIQYLFSVMWVSDLAGNNILTPVRKTFAGSTAADVTPPVVVYRSPAPGATKVAVSMPIGLRFSEPVTYTSLVGASSWMSNAGPVDFMVAITDLVNVSLIQSAPLATATTYTITLDGVQDLAGNSMPPMSWSFTTTDIVDATPPTVVSSVPADGATHVSVHADLSITFSEPVNQIDVDIDVAPPPGDGDMVWSNGGRTLTYSPDAPLLADQQYVVTILPGGVKDLADNEMTDVVIIRFTTGDALSSGHISGTIDGDALSDDATDPTGAYVIAATMNPMEIDKFEVTSMDVVVQNDTYNLSSVPDGTYYVFAIMNSNDDGIVDPSAGDAVGLYGMDIRAGDLSPQLVTVSGGNHVSLVDFRIFDPSAITGIVSYNGIYSGYFTVGVGLFFAPSFANPPVLGTTAFWPDYSEWAFHSLDGMVDDDYYIGAYLDVNSNGAYDPGDPVGFYGGGTPISIMVDRGRDSLGLAIVLQDPAPAN